MYESPQMTNGQLHNSPRVMTPVHLSTNIKLCKSENVEPQCTIKKIVRVITKTVWTIILYKDKSSTTNNSLTGKAKGH